MKSVAKSVAVGVSSAQSGGNRYHHRPGSAPTLVLCWAPSWCHLPQMFLLWVKPAMLLNQQKTWGCEKNHIQGCEKNLLGKHIFTSHETTKQAWFLMDPGPVRWFNGWWRCVPTAILRPGGALASSASFIQLPIFQWLCSAWILFQLVFYIKMKCLEGSEGMEPEWQVMQSYIHTQTPTVSTADIAQTTS